MSFISGENRHRNGNCFFVSRAVERTSSARILSSAGRNEYSEKYRLTFQFFALFILTSCCGRAR